ncbi:MAG: thioesterase family protein [Acidobacteriota bacterium]
MRDHYATWHVEPVRWGDMDAYGHVNNAKYFTYCESARMLYFQRIRLDEASAEESAAAGAEAPDSGPPAFGPALVQADLNFRRQVHYPAVLEVGVRATKVGTKSFTLEYVVARREQADVHAVDAALDPAPVADGSSVVVWVDYRRGASAPLPDALAERIRSLDSL